MRLLADAVRREGYRVWWDDEIPPHLAYGDVIAEKIGSAKAAIVVWSADSAASEWVRAEADVARGQKKLIQTSLDGREPPMPFNQIQVAPIGDWRGEDEHEGWRRVRQSLAALCGPGASDVAASAPPITVLPPGPPLPPPRRGSSLQPLLLALVGILTVIVGTGAFYLWSSSRTPGPDDNIEVAAALPSDTAPASAAPPLDAVAAPANAPDPGLAMPPTSAFTRRATIVDPSGQAVIRGGPSGLSPILGRVDAGDHVMTYMQSGDWWQVRSDAGVFGYLNRSQFRIDVPSPPAQRAERAPDQAAAPPAELPAQPAPVAVEPAASDPVRVQTVDPATINRRRYCAGPGRNTPQCIQRRQRALIRNQ